MDQQPTPKKENYSFTADGYPCPDQYFILLISICGRLTESLPACMNNFYSTESKKDLTECITVFEKTGHAKPLKEYVSTNIHKFSDRTVHFEYKKFGHQLTVYKTCTNLL